MEDEDKDGGGMFEQVDATPMAVVDDIKKTIAGLREYIDTLEGKLDGLIVLME